MKIAKITSRKIVVYTLGGNTKPKKEGTKMPIDNTVQEGELSVKAQTRLKNAIITLTECYAYKKENTKGKEENITFLTLTLCSKQKHDDKYIKRYMLYPFLEYLKDYENVTAYVWRAEAQENGNIHFHILANRFIKWRNIRTKWNSIQRKEGYIKEYQNKFKVMSLEDYTNFRLEEYNEKLQQFKDKYNEKVQKCKDKGLKAPKYNKDYEPKFQIDKVTKAYEYGVKSFWNDPNSTDIKKMDRIYNTVAYMTKYMAKNKKYGTAKEGEENAQPEEKTTIRPIEGHLWGKCDNIDKAEILELQLTEDLESFIRTIRLDKDNFIVEKDYFCLYYFGKTDYKTYPESLRKLYQQQQEDNYLILN